MELLYSALPTCPAKRIGQLQKRKKNETVMLWTSKHLRHSCSLYSVDLTSLLPSIAKALEKMIDPGEREKVIPQERGKYGSKVLELVVGGETQQCPQSRVEA